MRLAAVQRVVSSAHGDAREDSGCYGAGIGTPSVIGHCGHLLAAVIHAAGGEVPPGTGEIRRGHAVLHGPTQAGGRRRKVRRSAASLDYLLEPPSVVQRGAWLAAGAVARRRRGHEAEGKVQGVGLGQFRVTSFSASTTLTPRSRMFARAQGQAQQGRLNLTTERRFTPSKRGRRANTMGKACVAQILFDPKGPNPENSSIREKYEKDIFVENNFAQSKYLWLGASILFTPPHFGEGSVPCRWSRPSLSLPGSLCQSGDGMAGSRPLPPACIE